MSRSLGPVQIITAASSDPEMLTVKAARMLEGAGAVVFDDPALGPLARLADEAVVLQVAPWDDIPGLVAALAREGLTVVRLASQADAAGVACEADALRAVGIPVGSVVAGAPCAPQPHRAHSWLDLAFPPLFAAAV
ncbi:hypothetical protein [Novispirillum itersonii]|uniref:Uroporphyrin-III C-methyltransferase n=1 Tax=Novispirillum itersonii TaxID=189 RepID=A0A7W9ZF96_NOVIT|nr:hypothetical protein [Novispirillum itersonii]MBB6209547.1 uroporphyrin-III C-methyltransferase [Novispirillum itersonii]